jgi:trehalose-6-phosphate synthase
VAAAILKGLEMSSEEQISRMQHLRDQVRENNVYRWAANLLSDLTDVRIDTPERIEVQ